MEQAEARIVELALRGDKGAFRELVLAYQDKLYRLAYRMLGNAQEAEEAVQEAFLRVYRNLESYDPEQKFSTWIYRITSNLCIDRLRRKRSVYSLDAESKDGEGGDWHNRLASDEPSPEQQLLLTETQLTIREAIDQLPMKYKTIVILKYMQDLSLQEISDIVHLPVTTIKTRVHRGREYLRGLLEKRNLL